MGPQRRRRVQARAKKMLGEMLLSEVRKLSGRTQTELAAALGVKQPTLSRLEVQDDMQISMLRRIVEALGGKLEIVAKLPRGRFALRQFEQRAELQRV